MIVSRGFYGCCEGGENEEGWGCMESEGVRVTDSASYSNVKRSEVSGCPVSLASDFL